jgi:hypothetical protein
MDKSKRTQSAKSKPALDDVRGESSSRDLVTAGGKVIVRRDAETVVVSVPVRFYRRNGRQMILAESIESDSIEAAVPNNALLTALAKAYAWQEQLESGQFEDLEDIAKEQGVDRSYVGRMLQLTSLAPDIVESILSGQAFADISLRDFRKGIPVSWDEQRRTLHAAQSN